MTDSEHEPGVGTRLDIDQKLIMETVRRYRILSELQTAAAGPSDLEDALEISRSTIHRATKSLLELNLIRKSDGAFELTGVGEVVAEETASFTKRLDAAIRLEPLLNLVDVDVPVEHFDDAQVTQPKPRQPHFSVRRIIELIEESDEMRVLSSVISPFYVDVAHREMLDGMVIDAIFDERIIDIVLGEYEQKAIEAVETGNFEVYSHDGVPFELFLFDDRIGLAAHDENGIARIFVETDSPDAVEWAEELFERHLEEAQCVTGEH